MLLESETVVQAVAVPWRTAYDFAREPANLPQWASGLAAGIEHVEGHWYGQSPMGRVRIEMTAENPHGVLDHRVTLPDGTPFDNPFRVVPNREGALFLFTVFRAEGVDAAAFKKDVAHVTGDLEALRALLESRKP